MAGQGERVTRETGYDHIGIAAAFAALGVPLLCGAETVTEPVFETVIPDELRAMIEGAGGLASDADRLPTVPEGAHPGDETARFDEPAPAPATPEPAPEPEPTPAPAPAPAGLQLDPRSQRLAEQTQAELARIDDEVATIQSLRAKAAAAVPLVVDFNPADDMMPDEEWEKFKKAAVTAAQTADDFPSAIDAAFDQMRAADKARVQRRTEVYTQRKTAAERKRETDLRNAELMALEESARESFQDFDKVMAAPLDAQGRDAWALMSDASKVKDPALAKLVYAAVDPPRKAYFIARSMLAKAKGVAFDAPTEQLLGTMAAPSPAPSPAPAPETAPAPAAAPAPPAAPRTPAEARRAATAEVVDTIGRHTARPEGVDAFRPTGAPPPTRFSIEQLDRMQREQPDTYRRLIEANPDLDYFHMSGGLTR